MYRIQNEAENICTEKGIKSILCVRTHSLIHSLLMVGGGGRRGWEPTSF